MKITTIRLPDSLHKQIRHQAVDAGLSMNAWILQALEEKTKREPDYMVIFEETTNENGKKMMQSLNY